jgi:HSP20 family molecular chaperone IbpA
MSIICIPGEAMSLIRWDPFSDIDRTFNRMMRGTFANVPRFDWEGTKLEWSPSADISETDKEYLIRAELPAVKKEDVKVTVDGGGREDREIPSCRERVWQFHTQLLAARRHQRRRHPL